MKVSAYISVVFYDIMLYKNFPDKDTSAINSWRAKIIIMQKVGFVVMVEPVGISVLPVLFFSTYY